MDPQQRRDDEPVLPDVTRDERDSWGERPREEDPDDLERFLRDKPPHHL